jgi:hypothetical protein
MGIEKGHIAALKQMRKRLTPETARGACERLAAFGIRAAGTFILGGNGEQADDLVATVDFACSLPLDFAHFNPLAVYPGTQLYDETFGASTPWLPLCLDPSWAPRGDILWRSDKLALADITAAVVDAYRRFYSDDRLARVPAKLPESERSAAAAAYALLADGRAASLTDPAGAGDLAC